jgi:hypothetical protein
MRINNQVSDYLLKAIFGSQMTKMDRLTFNSLDSSSFNMIFRVLFSNKTYSNQTASKIAFFDLYCQKNYGTVDAEADLPKGEALVTIMTLRTLVHAISSISKKKHIIPFGGRTSSGISQRSLP